MILMTGASGNVGIELARILKSRGVRFRAMVRSPAAAKQLDVLAHAELVAGDFNDSVTVARALDGIDRAFLLTPSSEQAEAQQRAFVEVARREGVRHVVKLSQLGGGSRLARCGFCATTPPSSRISRSSGMALTFLRPNLFMQGLLALRASIATEGRFFAAAGDARISAVDVRDIAAASLRRLDRAGARGLHLRRHRSRGADARGDGRAPRPGAGAARSSSWTCHRTPGDRRSSASVFLSGRPMGWSRTTRTIDEAKRRRWRRECRT